MINGKDNQKPRIKVYSLGGLDENGKNCLAIEVDDSIFVVEAGLKFPDNFTPGVEFLIPDFSYLKDNANRVKAIIISHGHDDTYGALPYLLSTINAPCYLTKTTMALIRADYGKKFDLNRFNFVLIEPSSEIKIAGHQFSFFSTTHSISESFGFVLRTALGNIVYTGDFIADYNGVKNFNFDFTKVASIANEHNTLLLLSESCGADKPGICSPGHKLTPHIKSFIEEQDKRLFIAVYSQNFYNIQEIIDLAIANNKKIVILNRRMADALKDINATGNLVIPKANYCEPEEVIRYSVNDLIMLITGSGEEIFNLINSFSRDIKTHGNLCLTNTDRLILACPSVPGTETIATEALDACYQTGADVISLSRRQISSMHPQEEDLKMMLSLFRPKYYMPVKGEYRLLMANAKIALSTGLGYNYMNTLIFDNGMVLGIGNDKRLITTLPRVKEGSLMVDGIHVGSIQESVLQERQKLADDGIVVLSAVVSSKQQKLLSQPDIQMHGFIYLKDQANVMFEMNTIFQDVLHELMTRKMMSTADADKKLVERLSKYFRRDTKKNPIIYSHIINIDSEDF